MNSKRILSPCLQAALALCFIAQTLSAATSGMFTYTDDGTSITITGYPTSEVGVVDIPAVIAGKPVTVIGDDAFHGCSGLTGITIPPSVASIGWGAFYDCAGLASIAIPSSVTSIDESAFAYCTGLTSIAIPASITSIGDSVFDNCTGLKSVTIPASVKSIGPYAFSHCDNLLRVVIPNSVTSIGDYAFFYCTGLTGVTIPAGVTSIGWGVFHHCGSLASAFFKGNAPSMGAGVFNYTASGFTVVYLKGSLGFSSPKWQGYPARVATPEIAVQQPVGTNLVDGTARKNFGTVKAGQTSAAKTFTIRNMGFANLSGLAITKNGANAADFIVTAPAKTWLASGAATTFKVTFKPTAAGTRYAAIHIKSNDADENPFDIRLNGLGVVP